MNLVPLKASHLPKRYTPQNTIDLFLLCEVPLGLQVMSVQRVTQWQVWCTVSGLIRLQSTALASLNAIRTAFSAAVLQDFLATIALAVSTMLPAYCNYC